MIVYHTFRSTAIIIYILQPNADHHWNQKEILNQTEWGHFKKKSSFLMQNALTVHETVCRKTICGLVLVGFSVFASNSSFSRFSTNAFLIAKIMAICNDKEHRSFGCRIGSKMSFLSQWGWVHMSQKQFWALKDFWFSRYWADLEKPGHNFQGRGFWYYFYLIFLKVR